MSTRQRTAAGIASVLSAVLVLSSCGRQSAGSPTTDEQPSEKVSNSWKLTGSSATSSFEPLSIGTGWGPTAAEITRARVLVGRLSLRQRAGQVIVASYSGTSAPARLVNDLHLGGVVVFSENITSPGQIRLSNQALQRSVTRSGRDWPAFVGVDQEGGRVARVTSGATRFPTFMTAGAARDRALTRKAYAASGGELAGLGFTTDFAPVADVTMGPRDPAIGARSAGSSPTRVTAQSVAAMNGFASSGIVPVLKHFPGHGSVTTDSHAGLPVQAKSLRALRDTDLVPFRHGIAAGAPSVMVGHLDVRAVDPGMPSSLSRKVVTGLLRQEMGFKGLAVTDSLVMGAVVDRFGSARAAVRALRAGEDVVLMPRSARAARDGIAAAVREGRLSQARLDQAATRQVALLLHQKAQGFSKRPAGSSGAVSRQLSAAAMTVVKGSCSARLVGRSVHVTGPSTAVARFRSAASAAGLPTGRRGSTVRLVGYGGAAARGDVVVALDTPYVLGRSRAGTAKIAAYGDTPGAMRALVAVLLGRAEAPGTLPVGVADVPRRGC